MEGASSSSSAKPSTAAVCVVWIGQHSIKYYHATPNSDARFEATCNDEKHKVFDVKNGKWVGGRCRLTRHLSEANMTKAASRPLGMMVAWIFNHKFFNCFEEHQDEVLQKCIPLEQRIEARNYLRTLENGAVLMSFERKCLPGESEESKESPWNNIQRRKLKYKRKHGGSWVNAESNRGRVCTEM